MRKLSIPVVHAGHDLSFEAAQLIDIATRFIDGAAMCIRRGRFSVMAVSSDPGDVLPKVTAQLGYPGSSALYGWNVSITFERVAITPRPAAFDPLAQRKTKHE